MLQLVDFGNTLNWILTVNTNKKARLINGQLLIEPFSFKNSFNSSIIAIGVEVPQSRETWRSGGQLFTEFPFRYSSVNYNNLRKAYYKISDLIVDDISIIELPQFSTSYKLKYYPPNYFQEVNLQVWEYRGKYQKNKIDELVANNQVALRQISNLASNEFKIVELKDLQGYWQIDSYLMLAENQITKVLIELLDDNATVVHSNIWQLNEKHDFPIFTIEPNLRFKVTAIDGAVESLFIYLKSVNLAYSSHV